jgi:NAD(P)H-quinone oxidoreductase subunit J
MIKVEADFLVPFASALYAYGFNCLSVGRRLSDSGPGCDLVSFITRPKLKMIA